MKKEKEQKPEIKINAEDNTSDVGVYVQNKELKKKVVELGHTIIYLRGCYDGARGKEPQIKTDDDKDDEVKNLAKKYADLVTKNSWGWVKQ